MRLPCFSIDSSKAFLAACYKKSVHKKKTSGELPAPSWHKAVDQHRSSKIVCGKRQDLSCRWGAFMEMPHGPELQPQRRGQEGSSPLLFLEPECCSPSSPPATLSKKEGRNQESRDSNSTPTSSNSHIGRGYNLGQQQELRDRAQQLLGWVVIIKDAICKNQQIRYCEILAAGVFWEGSFTCLSFWT